MKALVWGGPERMQVEEMPEPKPEPGTVIVRPEAAGICGSEVEGYLGRMGNRTPPLIMGHEFAGEVVDAGEGVDGSWVGREVAVNPLLPCGHCPLCAAGLTSICPNRTIIGIQHPGGFAQYVRVPATNVYPVPEAVSAVTGALAEPFANGVHAIRLGLRQAQGSFIQHAVVIGAGPIGLLAMQAALLSGLPDVSVVEPYEARREQARQLGAHAVFASGDEVRERLREATGGLGADLTVDAVGAHATRQMAVQLLRPGGCAVMIGLHENETPLPFHAIIRNEITACGSYAYTAQDYQQALAWLAEGKAGIGEIPPVLPLERGPEIFSELSRGPSPQIKFFLADSAS